MNNITSLSSSIFTTATSQFTKTNQTIIFVMVIWHWSYYSEAESKANFKLKQATTVRIQLIIKVTIELIKVELEVFNVKIE